MEIIEHEVPPFELKLALQQDWIERYLADFFPKSIATGKTTLKTLAVPRIAFESDEIHIVLSFEIEHPLNIGGITGALSTSICLSQLADLTEIKAEVKKLEWQKGPKFEIGSIFGFSILRLAKTKIDELERTIGPRIEKEVAKQFLEHTEVNPFYLPYLQQQIPGVGLNLTTQVKKIFYRIDSQKELLELRLFPILEIQVNEEEISTEIKNGPALPGVGGGFIQYYANLSQAFIQKEISQRLIGRSIAAGNKNVTIENISISLENDLIIAQVHFTNEEFPAVTTALIPVLDSNNQIIQLDIEKLNMEKASWLLKGIFSFLKKNIEHKIEKNLQFDIPKLIAEREEQLYGTLNENLKQYELIAENFKPKVIVTKIFTIKEKLIIQGQVGGTIEIINKEPAA